MEKKFDIEFVEKRNEEVINSRTRAFLNNPRKEETTKLALFMYSKGPMAKNELVTEFSQFQNVVYTEYLINKMLRELFILGLVGSKLVIDSLNSPNQTELDRLILCKYKEFKSRLPQNLQHRFQKMVYHFTLPHFENFVEWAAKCVGYIARERK